MYRSSNETDLGVAATTAAAVVDVALLFPPQWSPFQPFLSTPSLKAYLEPLGFTISQEDMNVEFYEHFISPARLNKAKCRLRNYIDNLPPHNSHYRAKCALALVTLDDYAHLHAEVLRIRDPEVLDDVGLFYRRIKALEQLLLAFSTAEPVVTIGHSSFEWGSVLDSFDALRDFVVNRRTNPFIDFFENAIDRMPAVPRHFGLSVIGSEQIIPSLTLAKVLKARFPDIPVLVGGSVFSRIVDNDHAARFILDGYFDYVFRYEGEKPLAAFLASSDPKADRIPNLAFADGGEIVKTALTDPLAVNDCPTPDFSGLKMEQYLTPSPVLPLLTTRGCYWGKCAFCFHGMIYQDRYRMRQPELIARDLQILNQRFGASHFAFNDEALPPKLFKYLPESIEGGRFFFTGLYKFEKMFRQEHFDGMYKMGFRSLYIGLESASERLQRHMMKNNKQETMIDCLTYAHKAGIWNHAFNFFGFPTETEAEAKETADFLLEHHDIIHSEGTGTFSFEMGAPISNDPERFGIKSATQSGGVFGLYHTYEVVSGLDADGAERELAKFEARRDELGLYGAGGWIPREFLLLLLSRHSRDDLLAKAQAAEVNKSLSDRPIVLKRLAARGGALRHDLLVNTENSVVSEVNRDVVSLLGLLERPVPARTLGTLIPGLSELIAADTLGLNRAVVVETINDRAEPVAADLCTLN